MRGYYINNPYEEGVVSVSIEYNVTDIWLCNRFLG